MSSGSSNGGAASSGTAPSASSGTAPSASSGTAPSASSGTALEDVEALADVFSLLGDPGRLRILLALRDGERRVGELAGVAAMSESATSHALRILRAHRVVAVRRSGRMAFYALADAHVQTLLEVAVSHVSHAEPVHHLGATDG